AAGVLAAGVDVVDIGVTHPPLMYFATAHWNLDGGATVTGSHNPVTDNGVKMGHAGAAPVTEGEHQGVLQPLTPRPPPSGAGAFATGRGRRMPRAPRHDYFDAITTRVRLARPLKVVVDAGNGIAGSLRPEPPRRAGGAVGRALRPRGAAAAGLRGRRALLRVGRQLSPPSPRSRDGGKRARPRGARARHAGRRGHRLRRRCRPRGRDRRAGTAPRGRSHPGPPRPRSPRPPPRRPGGVRREVLAGAGGRHPLPRGTAGDVEDGPLPPQAQDARGRDPP